MSLLITRNNANGSPESYHNHLRDTFEVAPMSEIAVHTCIINRDPTYVVKGECDIYVYHGGYLSDADVTLNEVGYEAYMQFYGVAALWVDQPIVIHLKDGDYSLRDFAQEVQTALNTYDFHPSFQGKWTCTFDDVRAADGSFNGFKIENIQRGLDAPSSETGVTKVLNGGLTLNAATQRLTRGTSATYPQPMVNAARFNSCLNPAKGSVVFYLGPAGTPNIGTWADWAIGLQRYDFPAYSEQDGEMQIADFVLRYNQGSGALEYNEWVYDSTDNKMKRVKLPYIDGIGGDYDWQDNTELYEYLKVELENQKVIFSMAPDSAGGPGAYTVITTSKKAVGYSNYALFPSVGIGEENKFVDIHSFNAVPGYDTTIVKQMKSLADMALLVEESDIAAAETVTAVKKGVSASDATALDLDTVLIVGDALSDYLVTGTAMDELGYESAIDEGSSANPLTVTFTSEAVPDMISTSVLHVRVSALDVRTYNGVQSGISKILYTLPRFSDGSSSGRMHITPNEKTYLALNNTNTMHLNDIHVEFVNSDETLATDLTDKAMVIFHIKQGKHGGCGCK